MPRSWLQCDSRVVAMDETPIKAGRSGHGKMKTGYFWPIYGDHDEVCFPFFASRGSEHVRTALGVLGPGRVLLTDGYAAYEKYARKLDITHAQFWVHCRRGFFEALDADPEAVEEALNQIGALYEIEDQIRERNLTGEAKHQHRLTDSKPRVQAFFDWIDRQFERQGLLPSSPFTQALGYARERRVGLEVFLDSGCAHGYESSRARLETDSHGAAELALHLDRTRRQTGWHHPESAHDLSPARNQPVRLLGRCSAAH